MVLKTVRTAIREIAPTVTAQPMQTNRWQRTMARQKTSQHGRDTWIAVSLVILGALIYGFTVFRYDHFQTLERGENGQAAIQALDQMRRPFLALKQAELHLLQSGEASAVSGIESAVHDGRRKLSEYLDLAGYNEELRKKVVQLQTSYEAWVSLEWELVRRMEFLRASPNALAQHVVLDTLVPGRVNVFETT